MGGRMSDESARLRAVRRAEHVALAAVAVLAVLNWLASPRDLLAVALVVALAALLALVAVRHALARQLIGRRAARDAGITRMLQGMSRSVSSDAIVQTILDELRGAADADHVAVARLRPVERVVEVIVVSSRARVPASRSVLPASLLDPARLPAARPRPASIAREAAAAAAAAAAGAA
jgi:hypothetical protein